MPDPPSTGDAPLWDCYTTWKPSWNAKSPSNSKPPSNRPWTITSHFATIAAWLCIATTVMPAPLPLVTVKYASRYLCFAAANVAA